MDIYKLNININAPRYDQKTYWGRARHFFITTNPLNLLATHSQLEKAREVVNDYRARKPLPGVGEEDLWRAKNLYDSAFHPDTGEKMMLAGRMSAQVPCNMTITGCMMTFYRTTPAVVFWQWANQTFNAVVNYTNRSGDEPIPVSMLAGSYVAATGGAMATAIALNKSVTRFPPIVGRYVPFFAVAAANCINIPFMRSKELTTGIPVLTEDETKIGNSKAAAKSAIAQVIFSRICMAVPGMWIPPIIMQQLEKEGGFLKKYPKASAPVQVLMVGACLIFATPLCCALFPQQSSIATSALEDDLQAKLKELGKSDDRVYFNKGL